jgi:diguanylate cyclase (GGDEF)-like protein
VYLGKITATGSIQRLFGQILKKSIVFVVPASIIAAACFLVPRIAEMSPGRQELFLLAPYLITALGMFLSVHFHRGRPFMALLLLVVFYWSSRSFLIGRSLELSLNEVYQAFVLLIPANIALIAVMRERGVFSPAGRFRFSFLVVQAFIAFWFFRYNFITSLPFIAANFGLPVFMTPELVPQPAMFAGCGAFLLIAGLAVRRQAPIDAGLLGALTAFFIACNWITNPVILTVFSTAGALIVTLSVLRDSYNMAFRDDMTKLWSRRSLNESLSGLGRKYAIAMLDVDHFKKFNDTHGHDIGDQVLKMVARMMMDVGCSGKAFRYGGEEFTILFPGRRATDVIPELEKLRKAISEYRLALRNVERPKSSKEGKAQRGTKGEAPHVSVTISIGVAERGESLITPEEVMKAADKALYKAKSKGRNQVCR